MSRKMKLVAALLAVLMVVGMLAGCKAKDPASTNSNQQITGSTTELSGDWGNAWWTNNAADNDVRSLMNGYGTVVVNQSGEYFYDPTVVAEHNETVNEDGTKTFEVTIKKGLKYNDGKEITAKDYVGYLLVSLSPIVKEMGGKVTPTYYPGGSEYQNGEATTLKGVRLLDDYKFSVTINADFLPYFYDITYAGVSPLPLQMWLPEGADVKDDGEGAYLTGFEAEDAKASIEKARYLSEKRVCSGPYQLESFDSQSLQAVLTINPNYAGNFEGQKASIEKIIYVKVISETEFDQLSTGQVDVLQTLSEGAEIDKALDLESKGGFKTANYLRAGYGKLMFQCDFGPTQFVGVRHAIAYLLDRNDFATTFTGGYGSVVHGPYGLAMWMYKEGEEELNAKLNTYTYSVDSAIKELEDAGFVLDANGDPYKEGVRYKEVTAEEAGDYQHNVTLADGRILMPCIIEWSSSENNPVSELLAVKLANTEATKSAGVQINQHVMTFTELLNYMYRDSSQGDQYAVPTYGMYNLATNFTPVYDMSYSWTSDPDLVAQGYNTNFLFDEQLDKLSMDMVYGVESGDNDKYLKLWLQYVERWNELLPEVPLYSNDYHDVYADKFDHYDVSSYWSSIDQLPYMTGK